MFIFLYSELVVDYAVILNFIFYILSGKFISSVCETMDVLLS